MSDNKCENCNKYSFGATLCNTCLTEMKLANMKKGLLSIENEPNDNPISSTNSKPMKQMELSFIDYDENPSGKTMDELYDEKNHLKELLKDDNLPPYKHKELHDKVKEYNNMIKQVGYGSISDFAENGNKK